MRCMFLRTVQSRITSVKYSSYLRYALLYSIGKSRMHIYKNCDPQTSWAQSAVKRARCLHPHSLLRNSAFVSISHW